MGSVLEKLWVNVDGAYIDFLHIINQIEPDERGQSGVSGDWSAKDVLSHLIGWDQALQAFIANPEGFDPERLYDVDSFNAKSVSDRQHQTWEETLDELQINFASLQKALAILTVEMQIYDRVVDWLGGRRNDYVFHTHQIADWIDQNKEDPKP